MPSTHRTSSMTPGGRPAGLSRRSKEVHTETVMIYFDDLDATLTCNYDT